MSGRGTAGGVNFQAEVGALLGLHLALQLPLGRISQDLPGCPQRISFETSDSVDDIVVSTEVGTIFIQAKSSLRLSKSGSSSLGEVVEALVRQYLSWREKGAVSDASSKLLVVAVGDRTSRRISRDLREGLSRMATGAATVLPRALTDPLGKLSAYAQAAWLKEAGSEVDAEDLSLLLGLIRVIHIRADQLQQSAALLAAHLHSPADRDRVVDCLRLWGSEMAERGAGATRLSLLQHLEMRCSFPLIPSRPKAKTLHGEEAALAFEILNQDAILALAESGLFSEEQTVSRTQFDEEVKRFLAGKRRLMPVIGISGVGKTTAFARFSTDTDFSLPLRWLVRGADIHASDDGIRSLLARMIERAATRHALTRIDVDALVASLPSPPLIILDAINEAEVPGRYLRHCWIPNTLAWLAQSNVRLLLSCRPDRWIPMADAFPVDAVYLPTDRADEAELGPDPPQPSDVFRLGDFTEAEAIEAVGCYGFAGRIAPDEVRHPFLLAVAQDLRGDAAALDADFGTTIRAFVRRRVTRAVERMERPNWTEAVMSRLDQLAGAMLAGRTQTISVDEANFMFGAETEGIDALCEENLLALNSGYIRFQHDQVREYLQSIHLGSAAVSAELDPSPDIERATHAKGFWSALLQVSNEIRDSVISNRADRRRDRRSVDPSTAAFVLLREMADPSIADLLGRIVRSTRLHRGDHGAEWAWQVSVLTLKRMAPSTVRKSWVLEWLRRMLEREDNHFATTWPEQFASAAAAALVRSDLGFAELIEFLPLLARQERESWVGGSIQSRAHLEIYGETGDSHWQPFTFVDENPPGRLTRHLFTLDSASTARSLGCYLDYIGDLQRKNVRGHCRPPLTRIAAVLLYHFRHLDLGAICDAAVRATKGYSADLTEALAISNPAELAQAALTRMKNGNDVARLRHVVWNAAEHCSVWDGVEIYRRTLLALESEEGDERIWGARLFLERHNRNRQLIRSVLDEQEASALVATLDILRERAISLLADSVGRDEAEEAPEDYLYLLEASFDLALQGLQDQLDKAEGPSTRP
jgi:hypothetical protein